MLITLEDEWNANQPNRFAVVRLLIHAQRYYRSDYFRLGEQGVYYKKYEHRSEKEHLAIQGNVSDVVWRIRDLELCSRTGTSRGAAISHQIGWNGSAQVT